MLAWDILITDRFRTISAYPGNVMAMTEADFHFMLNYDESQSEHLSVCIICEMIREITGRRPIVRASNHNNIIISPRHTSMFNFRVGEYDIAVRINSSVTLFIDHLSAYSAIEQLLRSDQRARITKDNVTNYIAANGEFQHY